MERDINAEIKNMYMNIHVQGRDFEGIYKGVYEIEGTGTERPVVEVKTDTLKSDLEQLTDTIHQFEREHKIRIWRGYTDKTDSYLGHDWNPRFFVREIDWNSGQPPAVETHMNFKITKVEVFGPGNLRDYDYGVNIELQSIN